MTSIIKKLHLAVPKTALTSFGASLPKPLRAGSTLATLTSQSPSVEEPQPEPHAERPSPLPTKNIRLEAIKSVGTTQLHNFTQDLISRTSVPLFDDDTVDAQGQPRESIAQKQEATRLEFALVEAVAFYASKHATFSIRGQSIDVLGVEVSPDLKHARAYWCLPLGLDLRRLPHANLEQLVRTMQQRLDERGKALQVLVHTRLRAYYPPKIKWVASAHVSKDMKRGVSLESGKRKWT